MYFEDPTPVKCDEIREFVRLIKEAIALNDPLEDDRYRRFYSVQKGLPKASQAAFRCGRHNDGDTAEDVAKFLDRLVADSGFKQYMSERAERIEEALEKGQDVEVVPLRHQYGNYRAMRMRV